MTRIVFKVNDGIKLIPGIAFITTVRSIVHAEMCGRSIRTAHMFQSDRAHA